MTRSKPKVRKEAAVFIRGIPIKPINFPPFEGCSATNGLSAEDGDALRGQHRDYEIHPPGQPGAEAIADFRRRIPYKSEKRSMGSLADRDAFEGACCSRTTMVEQMC